MPVDVWKNGAAADTQTVGVYRCWHFSHSVHALADHETTPVLEAVRNVVMKITLRCGVFAHVRMRMRLILPALNRPSRHNCATTHTRNELLDLQTCM
jgi:hypothetical protein